MRFIRSLLVLMLLMVSTASACELEYSHGVPIYGSDVACSAKSDFTDVGPDDSVVVSEGVAELAGEVTCLDVLVQDAGTIVLQPGSVLRCRTLTYRRGGMLVTMPGFTVITRDMPIETGTPTEPGKDPTHWGHGIIGIDGGTWVGLPGHSRTKTWHRVVQEPKVGHKFVDLDVYWPTEVDWEIGDQIVIPDTRQPKEGEDLSAQTEVRTITGRYRNKFYFDEPLEYDHLGWHKQDGSVGLLPHVMVNTRSSLVCSENPNGVRGHSACIGTARAFIEDIEFRDYGRTTTDVLDSTRYELDPYTGQKVLVYIGDNEIGKYAHHYHHCIGFLSKYETGLLSARVYLMGDEWQGYTRRCSFVNAAKWGISVHYSHWIDVSDCTAFNCKGCGFVTEQPYSFGGRIRNNMIVALEQGSGQRIVKEFGGRSPADDENGDFWTDAQGIGLSSAMCEVTNNAAYCCKEGIALAGCVTAGVIPIKFPAGKGTTEWVDKRETSSWMGWGSDPKRYPFLYATTGNLAWGCLRGFETWNGDAYPGYLEKCFNRSTIVHCRTGFETDDHFETTLEDITILGDWSEDSIALDAKDNYRVGVHYIRLTIRGMWYVYRYVNDDELTEFVECTLECPNVFLVPDNCPTNRLGSQYREIRLTRCQWDMPAVLVPRGLNTVKFPLVLQWRKNQPTKNTNESTAKTLRTFVEPWVDGKDYQVFWLFQHPDFALDPIGPGEHWDDWPDGVFTHQELIELGKPIYGDAVPATAVQRADFGPLLWASELRTPQSTRGGRQGVPQRPSPVQVP